MSAATSDKITDVRNAARPNSARATGTRSSGAASLACDNLAGWPDNTKSKVHFVTYQIDSNSNPVAGTQLDCYGIVSGNSINSFTVVDGTDNGNSVGDVVEMLPTAAWAQDLAEALTAEHDRQGKHTAITGASAALTGNASVGGTLGVTGTATHSGATVLTGAVSGAGYSMGTMSNPYKFSAYNSGNQTIGTSQTQVTFNTELYDTGSNYASNAFTAPIAGFYHFDTTIQVSAVASLSATYLEFRVNGSPVKESGASANATTNTGNHLSADLQLSANDVVTVYCAGNVSFTCNGGATYLVLFNGHLISAT